MAELSREEMLKLINDQKALIEKLATQATAPRAITMKVGDKGTLCLYHGARYPIALYVEQWERLLPFLRSGKLEEFAKANASLLKRRADD